MKASGSIKKICGERSLWSLGIAAFIMTAMSGCGPIYKTEYILQPPETQQGQVCIMQCEQNRTQCKNKIESERKDCGHRNEIARLKLENCIASGAAGCLDTRTYCPELNFEQCNKEHRYCYQSCGGTVIPQVTCAGYWGGECN